MDNTQYDKILNSFFQIFSDSIAKTLSNNLDPDVFTKNQFEMKYTSRTNDTESFRENNAVYRLDFAIGTNQGVLAILIPEEIIATISDVLTGGTGQDAYKGSLSEIETNSILKILEKTFKNIESDFKKYYEHDLAFSTNSTLILKEMPEYQIGSHETLLDFVIHNTLTLNEEQSGEILVLMNNQKIDEIISSLGLHKNEAHQIKAGNSSLNIERLSDVKINITAELGRTRVPIKHALELVRGSLIELDTLNNSDIKVYANGIEFAHAQVVAVEDNFGLKITKIVSPEERLDYA